MLTNDKAARKAIPLARGLLDYFPDALCAVAELSRIGNEQHNPGEPLHWAKEKSTDEADALMRHLIDRGKIDIDGVRHSTKVAWRALALLQREIESEAGFLPLSVPSMPPLRAWNEPLLRDTCSRCGHATPFPLEHVCDPLLDLPQRIETYVPCCEDRDAAATLLDAPPAPTPCNRLILLDSRTHEEIRCTKPTTHGGWCS
jgi:hypothetical protein